MQISSALLINIAPYITHSQDFNQLDDTMNEISQDV